MTIASRQGIIRGYPILPFTTIENNLKTLSLLALMSNLIHCRARLSQTRVVVSNRKNLSAPMASRVTKLCSPRGSACVNVKTIGGRSSRYWCCRSPDCETKLAPGLSDIRQWSAPNRTLPRVRVGARQSVLGGRNPGLPVRLGESWHRAAKQRTPQVSL